MKRYSLTLRKLLSAAACRARRPLIALCAAVLVGCGAEADIRQPSTQPEPGNDWPRFLGPSVNGISKETNWSNNWTADGPKQLWTAKVGIGFGSIAISGGRALTVGHAGGKDTVWAFDAATGDVLWKHAYDSKVVDNLYEGGPNATPTIDGARVYTLGKEGQLFALAAADGGVLWKADFQKDFGVSMPDWGFSSSPLVLGKLVIVDAGHVVAFDKTTGAVVWKTEKAHRPGYGSAVAFHHGGQDLIAVLNNDALLILRSADGTIAASHPWETSFATTSSTPVIAGDTIFISTGYNRGCALLRMTGDGLSAVYENKKMRNHFNNSILWEKHLYGFDGQSNQSRLVKLVCMDHASGEVRWQERGLGCGSLVIADGRIIALSDEGELVVAEANPEAYKPLAKAKVLEGRCWTAPALSHGRVYCRNAAGDLVCLDVRK